MREYIDARERERGVIKGTIAKRKSYGAKGLY